MDYGHALTTIEAALKGRLPGQAAHQLTAPRPRREWPADFNPDLARAAAGLLLLFPIEGRAHIVLTVRSDALERHRGQVSLPGGVVEPGETFEAAALREAAEEVGLLSSAVRTLGALTPVDIPVSGFRLHPIAATAATRPEFSASRVEVARILEVPVEHILAPASLTELMRVRDGRELVTPAFTVDGHEIWGATAMVLAEFLSMLGWPKFGREART